MHAGFALNPMAGDDRHCLFPLIDTPHSVGLPNRQGGMLVGMFAKTQIKRRRCTLTHVQGRPRRLIAWTEDGLGGNYTLTISRAEDVSK